MSLQVLEGINAIVERLIERGEAREKRLEARTNAGYDELAEMDRAEIVFVSSLQVFPFIADHTAG